MSLGTVIVHIGAHKTGTTSVQEFFLRNADALSAGGVSYPKEGTDADKFIYGHHNLAASLAKSMVGRGQLDVSGYLTGREGMDGCIVLSSEDFCLLKEEEVVALKGLLEGFSCHVIMYIRRQDLSVQAMYQTEVINYGLGDPIEIYFRDSAFKFDYAVIAERWCRVFGEENFHISLYERGRLRAGDIVADFLGKIETLLGRPLPSLLLEGRGLNLNASLPAHVVLAVNYYNRFEEGKDVALAIRHVSERLYAGAHVSLEVASPSFRREILAHYEYGNKKICKKFFRGLSFDEIFSYNYEEEDDVVWHERYDRDGAHIKILCEDFCDFYDSKEVFEPR